MPEQRAPVFDSRRSSFFKSFSLARMSSRWRAAISRTSRHEAFSDPPRRCGMHSECATLSSHTLSLHRTLRSHHDRACTCVRHGGRLRKLWMDIFGRAHCRRERAHMVGHGAGMGKFSSYGEFGRRLGWTSITSGPAMVGVHRAIGKHFLLRLFAHKGTIPGSRCSGQVWRPDSACVGRIG